MSDSGPSRSTDWPTAGTSSSSVNVMYEQAEDEPSSSIPVSSSSDYGPTSSESFVSASYRSQPVFQANEQFQTDRYSIQGPSISGHIYQAAESSLPSRQDVSADQYGDIVAVGNEAQVQIYSNINNNENTYRVSHSQPASSSSVADGGYSVSHMIVDGMIVEAHDNPVTVGLQRVISPDVDSTVSQSVSSIPVSQRNVTDGEHSALSQIHRGNNEAVISMQVSQPQSEVSTSGETMSRLGQGHCHDNNDIEQENMETGRNQEVEAGPSGIMPQGEKRKYKYILTGSSNNIDVMESDVSSITESGSNEAEVNLARTSIKTDRRSLDDIVSGEPDTTQLDDDDNGDDDDGGEEYNQNEIDNSSTIENREELSTDMLPIDTHPSSSNNIVDSTQMMTVALPVSNSIVSANQIAASNLSTNYIPVNISEYQEQIQAPPPAHLNLTSNEIALSQLTANQLAASIEPQLSQATYILDTSSIDSSSKLNPSDLGLQIVNFMSVKVDPNIDEPGTSAESTSSGNRRKSTRIATIDNGESTWKLPEYISRPYNPNQLWCDECMQGYDTECEIHKLSLQPDKIVFSRAWASLPSGLQIFKLTQDDNALGVFTKRTLPKRTQFGPFIADMIPDDSSVTNPAFPLMVERQGTILYYDTTDENKCNWMMFVRPAQSYAEQNVVAYQYDGDIYFTVTKDITEPRTELKVWYAAHYAERWDKPCHKATDEDLKAIEESMCRFQCYECPKRFRTAAVLQKHLISHDSDPPKGSSTDEPSSSEAFTPPRRIRKSLMPKNILRQKLIANKKESGQYDSSGNMSGIFHWKKRSTNIYLNKTLKKYHKRHDAEMLRKSALSNQQMLMKNGENRSGEENSEWSCESCDLIFNNLTLLNLHMLFHSEDNTEEAKLTLQLEALLGTNCSADQVQFTCPGCGEHFFNKKDLIHHVSDHALPKSAEKLDYHSDIMNMSSSSNRQHRCSICMKTFTTIDRLAKHHQCHGDDSQKPFQCTVCFKRFMNNSALSCHMKTHSSAKYYQCPICHIGFDHTSAMREHSLVHANPNGTFSCPHCEKVFVEFLVLKKHVRGFHTNRTFPCEQCDKVFPRADKLRLHMLRHSTVRDFMCDTCGRQFKRKDKLKEHIKRMHSADREERDRMKALRPVSAKRFIPKVSPNEYHRFIYKCHLCLLGFKRRGMLVNHIAKRHPDLKPESVPELNLPILKTQRDYYCQYCDKVYKSSSKRKSHILKNHPGSELPQSARKKTNTDEIPGMPNPTYSQTVGSITTMPHQCEHCHKQYASKAKLLQHQRKHHPELLPHIPNMERIKRELPTVEAAQGFTIETVGETADNPADLLTQAMSELTQCVEYRQVSGQPGEPAYLTTRIGQGTPTMVQIQTPGGHGTQTIELAHLSQALQHFAPPQGHLPIQVQVSSGVTGQIQIPIATTQGGSTGSGTHILTVDQIPTADNTQAQQGVSTTQSQQLNFLPISIANGTYISKPWNNYQYKQH